MFFVSTVTWDSCIYPSTRVNFSTWEFNFLFHNLNCILEYIIKLHSGVKLYYLCWIDVSAVSNSDVFRFIELHFNVNILLCYYNSSHANINLVLANLPRDTNLLQVYLVAFVLIPVDCDSLRHIFGSL